MSVDLSFVALLKFNIFVISNSESASFHISLLQFQQQNLRERNQMNNLGFSFERFSRQKAALQEKPKQNGVYTTENHKQKSRRRRILRDFNGDNKGRNLQHSRSNSRLEQKSPSRSLSRNHSHRCIYIAEEASGKNQYMNNYNKDIGTIFHSPYKNGRKNLDYQNPSFISNHLFYQHVVDLKKAEKDQSFGEIKRNIVLNKNDIEHQKLYQKRMEKSLSKTKSLIALATNEGSTIKNQKIVPKKTFAGNNKTRIIPVDPAQRLRKQLQILQSYKQHEQRQIPQKRPLQYIPNGNADVNYITSQENNVLSVSGRYRHEPPCYLNIKRIQKQDEVRAKQVNELRKWNQFGNQLKVFQKKQNQTQRQVQQKAVLDGVNKFRQSQLNKAKSSIVNANLLNQILQQQIENKRIKKRKEKQNHSRVY